MEQKRSVSECLNYLVETESAYGHALGQVKVFEHKLKVVKAIESLKQEGKSATEREAKAMATEAYQEATKKYNDAVYDKETLGTKRKTCELIIEVWRTQQADRRTANIG